MAVATIATLVLLAASSFKAQAQGAKAGARAQGITNGNIYTPPCSIERPGDAGIRMHTNFHILLSPQGGLLLMPMLGGAGGVIRPEIPEPPFTPAEMLPFYDLPALGTGGSEIIAVVDAYHDPNSLSDFNAWSSFFGLPTEPSTNATASTNHVFQVVYAQGTQPTTDPAGPGGWDLEESLDIEWAHAMAPTAKIILVECANNNTANLLAGDTFVTGYTDGNGNTVKEISNSWGGSEFSGETSFDSTFTSTLCAYFCSAGDGGAPANWPSASPYVVSAGGTTINVNASGVFQSETGWNDGGGGPSLYEARPSYQNIISGIVGSVRGTPDIAYDANPNTGVWVYDSYYDASIGEPGEIIGVGGTSLSSPALAGIANVAATTENGFPAGSQALLANIYKNYANFYTGSPGDVFRDITSGNNGHAATTGWDYVTGVGSPLGVPGFWNIGTPSANSQTVAVPHNSSGTSITLTGSDPDSPALPLVYSVGTPSHGSLSGTAPNLTYTPNANYHGADSFQFTVTNSFSLPTTPVITDLFYTSTAATVTLNVGVGTPTANPQSDNVSFNTAKSITLTATDLDTPALTLTYAIATSPTHGALSGTAPNVTYTPTTGYHGADSFTFTASNGTNTSAAATVSLTVAAGVPTANPQTVTVTFNTAKSITLTGSDPDVPALSLTYAIGTSPTHGTLSGTAPNVTYTPNTGYNGADSFTFTVNNGINTSPAATVTLNVGTGVPTANSQSVSTNQDTAKSITLTGSDPDTPPLSLTYAVATSPTHGTLSGSAPNLTYTPNAGYYGSDSFTFTVNNGINTSAPATVSITVVQTAFDVSAQITITRGPFLYSRASGMYEQVVTLTNTGAAITSGPISLILGSLANATLTNATGTTSTILPSGRPYVNASVSSLATSASTTITLLFNKGAGSITYTTQVIAGPGSR